MGLMTLYGTLLHFMTLLDLKSIFVKKKNRKIKNLRVLAGRDFVG
jgi:hypothetical protein